MSCILRVGHDSLRARIGHELGTCPVHTTRARFMFDTCTTCVPISGHVLCTEKDLGSFFLMQVAVVWCFGVQLRVIFPY
jgi:hypothetical protein